MEKYNLRVKIDGMHCGGCINHITNVLERNGATDVDINIARKFGMVEYEGDKRLAHVFVDAIEQAGYTPTLLSVLRYENNDWVIDQ